MKCLFYDSSSLTPQGLSLRGKEFSDLRDFDVESMFWHSLTGTALSLEESAELKGNLRARQGVPPHIDKMIESLPKSIDPVTAFSIGVLGLQRDSQFSKSSPYTGPESPHRRDRGQLTSYAYEGVPKRDQFRLTMEDVFDLLVKAPEVVGKVYLHKYAEGRLPKSLEVWDRLAEVMGLDAETLRFVLCLRGEKEGGRIDAHLASCVSSTLADAYYSYSAAVNAFAGPRLSSGLAASVRQLKAVKPGLSLYQIAEQFVRTDRQLHANPTHYSSALDSRLQTLKEFLMKLPANQLISSSFELSYALPLVMAEDQAAALTFDLMTGAALYTGGLRHGEFYPVIDALASGVTSLANVLLNRVLMLPIEYPISTDLAGIEEVIKANTSS
jgi:citrate synthase